MGPKTRRAEEKERQQVARNHQRALLRSGVPTLGGSWVVISRVISTLNRVYHYSCHNCDPLVATHEPPRKGIRNGARTLAGPDCEGRHANQVAHEP